MRRLMLSFVLALATACASTIPSPQIPSVPAPPVIAQGTQIAIFTVDVEPQSATVRVGSREWVSPIGKVVEEFPAGETYAVTVRAPGHVPQTFDVSMTAGRMSPVKIVLAALPNTAVVKWGGVICPSYYASATDPDLDLAAFADYIKAVGGVCTRTWLLDAWSLGERDGNGQFLRGQYDGFIPVVRLADGRFDMSRWNDAYFARLRRFTEIMNSRGVWPHFTILELYTWSDRKAGLPFVPNVERQPYRNNINGVRWGNPDDRSFGAPPYEDDPAQLPDPWLRSFICKVVTTLQSTTYAVEIGNEMAEKSLHDRIAAAVRVCGYTGDITVNRNEDTPGQIWNMGVDRGQRFDRLALHGKLDMSYLDEDFPEEAGAGRPRTFRAMWPLIDASRIILSSDGGGGNPVHHKGFLEVGCDALGRGASVEFQLALKRNRFFGDGSLRMADLEIDRAMLKALASCRPQPAIPFILPIAA